MSHQAHRSFRVPLPLLPGTQLLISGWHYCQGVVQPWDRTPQSVTREAGVGGQADHSISPVANGVWGSGVALRTELEVSWGNGQYPSPSSAQACTCQFYVRAEWGRRGKVSRGEI